MSEIVKFPDAAYRKRAAARRPRRSKNGTPEERAAAEGKQSAAAERVRRQRNSKNGTPEERAAKRPSAKIVQIVEERDRAARGELAHILSHPHQPKARTADPMRAVMDQSEPPPITAA